MKYLFVKIIINNTPLEITCFLWSICLYNTNSGIAAMYAYTVYKSNEPYSCLLHF